MLIEDERSTAVAEFGPILDSYSGGTDINTIVSDVRMIERRVSPDYPYSGIGNFLFQYYGSALVSKAIPNLQTLHARIDYDNTAIQFIGTNSLPAEVQGYPSADIIGVARDSLVDRTLTRRANGVEHRADISIGLCDSVSRKLIRLLSEKMPNLETELTRVDWDASHPAGSARHPTVMPVGSGHSVVRMAMLGQDIQSTKSLLNIDPTIAQIDHVDDYDIELAIVPSWQYDTFIRLRYGALPNTAVKIRPATMYV
jgi:hypothetical protein